MLKSLTPLTPKTLADDCYQVLKDAILNLELAPRTPLVEAQVAARLHTSKTPVREAIARLATEGLVQTSKTGRSTVAGLSVPQVRQLFELRSILEPAAILRLRPPVAHDHLTRLSDLIVMTQQALNAGELRQCHRACEEFHSYLLELHENALLTAITKNLYDQSTRARTALLRVNGRQQRQDGLLQREIGHHRDILAALERGDPPHAASGMELDLIPLLQLINEPATERALAQEVMDRSLGTR